MITPKELTKAIQAEIDLLPKSTYAISIATDADDADTLALVIKHIGSLTTVCAWDKSIEGGTESMKQIRTEGVSVLARNKQGELIGLLTYRPDDPMVWVQAGAADETKPIGDQVKAIFALSIPAHRAMLKLGYTRLITKNMPKDGRMIVFAGRIFSDLKIAPAEHKLSGDGVTVTHWGFGIDIADALKVFEESL